MQFLFECAALRVCKNNHFAIIVWKSCFIFSFIPFQFFLFLISNLLVVFFSCRYLNSLKNLQLYPHHIFSYKIWILLAWRNLKSFLKLLHFYYCCFSLIQSFRFIFLFQPQNENCNFLVIVMRYFHVVHMKNRCHLFSVDHCFGQTNSIRIYFKSKFQ